MKLLKSSTLPLSGPALQEEEPDTEQGPRNVTLAETSPTPGCHHLQLRHDHAA